MFLRNFVRSTGRHRSQANSHSHALLHAALHTNTTDAHKKNESSRLHKLVQECATELKLIKVDRHLKVNMAKLDDKFRARIYDELLQEFDDLPDFAAPDDSLFSKNLAQGWELICAIQSTRYFLDNYEVNWPGMNLGAAIHTRHYDELRGSFQESFISLKAEDRILLTSTIDPCVFREFGIRLNADELKAVGKPHQRKLNKLNFDQVLALLDYAHYSTGTFNGINCGMRVFEYSRIRTIADVISCVQQPLIEALALLRQQEAFIFTGNLIKGIQINNPSGPLKRAKLCTGNMLTIPHPTSTTSDPLKSYAQRGTHDSELVFLNATGVKIHLFHNKLTVNEMEVLIPAEGIYTMVNPDTNNADRKGSIERFYCRPVQTVSLGPDPSAYV
jgi:hypothetical protein